jgi:probable F420-dependent oxidoreductase
VKLAIAIPQTFPDGAFDPASFRAYLRRAEELGFESAWTQEQILGAMPSLDPVDMLTYAAACTERLRLGCAVLLTALRSPVHLARSLATIDQLSRGRLEVGVGLGGQPQQAPAFGVDPGSRVARFNEGLRLMKALWTEPSVTCEGRFWQLRDARMEPKPLQKPRPPIWFGANHPNALRRAVAAGDGFFGGGSTPTPVFAEQVRTVRALLEEAGRDPAGFPLAKRIYIAVDDDAGRAGRRVADWFLQCYGRPGVERAAVWGPPDHCAEQVREVAATGVERILLTALFDEAEQLERLAAEVVPRLS